jgi:hypothetical protein
MAHGFRCVKCGYQETDHMDYRESNPGCCAYYQSPDIEVETSMWYEGMSRYCQASQRRAAIAKAEPA